MGLAEDNSLQELDDTSHEVRGNLGADEGVMVMQRGNRILERATNRKRV
jgi:hypothetical protein